MAVHSSQAKISNKEWYFRQLDGVYDLCDIAVDRIDKGKDKLGNASLAGDQDFTGTTNLAEAVGLCNNGWPEGVDRISDVVDKIELDSALLRSANRLDRYYDVAGDEPDIDRYLQGEPENMNTYMPELNTHGTILDIVLNVSQPAFVAKEKIINRGAAVLSAVEALRSRGYSIGVIAVERNSNSSYEGSVMQYSIPILAPGEAINVDSLAFCTMHPSFLRRLIFAANEAEDNEIRRKFGYKLGGGYGYPMSISDYEHDRPAHIIEKDEGLTSSEKEVSGFAQKLARACLQTLGVGET